jgi:CRP-like cAMP-binding protein
MSTPELLKKIDLFRECTNAELIKIGNLMQKVNFNEGDIIFKKGAPGDALYLIREGEVEVLSPKSEDDQTEDVVAVLRSGDLFGEMALVEGEPRSATVRAGTEAKLWRIRKEYFEDIMNKDHAIAFKVYRRLTMILSRRLRETTERLAIANEIIRMTSRKETKSGGRRGP